MTPKQKARELFDKMCYWHMVDGGSNQHEAKQCALIAVDEIGGLSFIDDYLDDIFNCIQDETTSL
jgi:hypothetical protein